MGDGKMDGDMQMENEDLQIFAMCTNYGLVILGLDIRQGDNLFEDPLKE